MYVKDQLVLDRDLDHDALFLKKNPNPLTKKYKEIFKCHGEYLNTDNDSRGMYLVAERYDLLDEDRSYKHFFKRFHTDSRYCEKLMSLIGAKSTNFAVAGSNVYDIDNKTLEFNNVTMTVEEFTRFHPTGNYLLVCKCIIKNNCTQLIPIFEGQFLNNVNCHKWAVVYAYELYSDEEYRQLKVDNPDLYKDQFKNGELITER